MECFNISSDSPSFRSFHSTELVSITIHSGQKVEFVPEHRDLVLDAHPLAARIIEELEHGFLRGRTIAHEPGAVIILRTPVRSIVNVRKPWRHRVGEILLRCPIKPKMEKANVLVMQPSPKDGIADGLLQI
jgi:hypothetical protein